MSSKASTTPTRRAARALATLASGLLLAGACALSTGCASSTGQSNQPGEDTGPTLADLEVRIAEATELWEQGLRAEMAEEEELALNLYRQSVQAFQGWGPAWHNLGVIHIRRGERLEAVQALLRAADLMPTDPHPVHNLGVLYEPFDPRRAKERYTEALGRNEMFLPSLRRIVVLDQRYHWWDENSDQRIRTGLLLEQDPDWIALFQRAQTLVKDES